MKMGPHAVFVGLHTRPDPTPPSTAPAPAPALGRPSQALARMGALGLRCRDVRTREVGIQDIHHQVTTPPPATSSLWEWGVHYKHITSGGAGVVIRVYNVNPTLNHERPRLLNPPPPHTYTHTTTTATPVAYPQVRPDQVELVRRDYWANGGWETFLSYEDPRQVGRPAGAGRGGRRGAERAGPRGLGGQGGTLGSAAAPQSCHRHRQTHSPIPPKYVF